MNGTDYRVGIVIDANGKPAIAEFDAATGAITRTTEAAKLLGTASRESASGVNTQKESMRDAVAQGQLLSQAFEATARHVIGFVRNAVEAGSKAAELSEQLGVSTEFISEMGYVASQSNTDIGTLTGGLETLAQNSAKAAGGSAPLRQLFRDLGVDVEGAGGKLRSLEELLPEIADRFTQYENGPAKAALATKLFGAEGEKLIPLLNKGSAGIAELRAEAERLGLSIDGEAAAASARLNDNLDKLNSAMVGVGNEIAEDLVPILAAVSELFVGNGERAVGMADDVGVLTRVLQGLVIVAAVVKGALEAIINVAAASIDTVFGIVKVADDTVRGAADTMKAFITDGVDGAAAAFERNVGKIRESSEAASSKIKAAWSSAGSGIDEAIAETTAAMEAALKPTEVLGTTSESTAGKLGSLEAPVLKTGRALRDQTRAAEDADKTYRNLIKTVDPLRALEEEHARTLAELREQLDDNVISQEQYAERVALSSTALAIQKLQLVENTDAYKEAKQAVEDLEAAEDRLIETRQQNELRSQTALNDLEDEIRLLRLTGDARAEATLRLRAEALAYGQTEISVEQFMGKLRELEQLEGQAAAAEEFQGIWIGAAESILDVAVEGLVDGFDDAAEEVKDIVKRMVIDLLRYLAQQQFIVPIQAQMTGGGGGGWQQALTGGGGGGGGGGGFNWMSLLSSAGGTWGSGANGIMAGAGQQLMGYGVSNALGTGYGMFGTAGNYAAAAAYGPPQALAGSGVGMTGAAAGALGVFGGLGVAYMGAATGNPVWGAAGGAAGAAMIGSGLSAWGFAQAGAAVGGPWGLIIGAVIGIIASFFMKEKPPKLDIIGSGRVGDAPYANLAPGMTFDSALGGGAIASIDSVDKKAREQFILGIQQFDAAIAQFLTPEQLAEIKQRISTSTQTFSEGAITVENILGGRLSLVLQSFPPEVAAYVNSLEEVQDKIEGFGGAAMIWRDFEGANTLGLETFSETLNLLVEMTKEGENLGNTIARVVPGVAMLDAAMEMFGAAFDGTRRDFIQFTEDLVEAAGGLEQLAALTNAAFSAVFSPEQIAAMNVERAREAFADEIDDIGLGVDATAADIAAIITSALESGNEALYLEALEAAAAFGMLQKAIDALAQAAGTAGDEINGVVTVEGTRLGGEIGRAATETEGARNEFFRWIFNTGEAAGDAADGLQDFAGALGTISAGEEALQQASRLEEIMRMIADVLGQGAASFEEQAFAIAAKWDAIRAEMAQLGASEGQRQLAILAERAELARLVEQEEARIAGLQREAEVFRNFLNAEQFAPTSTLSAADRLAEARRQLDAIVARADAGDATARAGVVDAAQRFLQENLSFNGSSAVAAANRDFARAIIDRFADQAEAEVASERARIAAVLEQLERRLDPVAAAAAPAPRTQLDDPVVTVLEATRVDANAAARALLARFDKLEKAVGDVQDSNRAIAKQLKLAAVDGSSRSF